MEGHRKEGGGPPPESRGIPQPVNEARHPIGALLALGMGQFVSLASLFIVASLLVFGAMKAVPGDPVALAYKNPQPRVLEQRRAELGLDGPLWQQYVHYISSFWSGDWKNGIKDGIPVREEVARRLPATLELSICALALGIFVGITATLVAEWMPSGLLRRIPEALAAVGLTVPIFWLGLMFIVVGSLWLGWFPSTQRFDPILRGALEVRTGFFLVDSLLAGRLDLFGTVLRYLCLPTLCLSVYPAALISRFLQARLAEPRLRLLIRGLRAKGVPPLRIWFGHVLKLLGAPLITVAGTNFGLLLGGAVLTETVFSWPGMGQYLVEGVLYRDLPAVLYGLLLVILLVFVVVRVSDVCARLINPESRRAILR